MIQVKKKRKRKKIKSDDEKKYESNTKVNMYFKQSFLTGYKFFYVLLLFPSAQLRFSLLPQRKTRRLEASKRKKLNAPLRKTFSSKLEKIHRFENNNRTTGHSRNMYFCPEKNPLRPSHASSPRGSKGSRLVP
jgi:hypothetical protein